MDTEEVKKERKKAIRILLDKWVKNYDLKSKAILIKKIPGRSGNYQKMGIIP